MKRRNDDDEMDGIGGDNSFPVTAWEGGYSIYLLKGIQCASQMTEALQAFASCKEEETVIVYLSTPGGCIDATDTFLDAMKECRGRVVVKASGGVHSAGTLILLNAPEFTLSKGFNSLFHNGSVGHGGKYSDWVAAGDFARTFMPKMFRDNYEGFFTEEEIEDLIKGADFWMDADGFLQRYKMQAEYFKKKYPELSNSDKQEE
jgi:ATP-dependent protease ClpP protease subunit